MDWIQHHCAGIPEHGHISFHLCYGELGGKRFIEPEDLGLLVEFANDILETVRPRTVNLAHISVPKDRDDLAYLEPLKGLVLDELKRLVWGLLHFDEERTKHRLKAAQETTRRRFSVATER